MTLEEMAQELGIQRHTVQRYIKSIMLVFAHKFNEHFAWGLHEEQLEYMARSLSFERTVLKLCCEARGWDDSDIPFMTGRPTVKRKPRSAPVPSSRQSSTRARRTWFMEQRQLNPNATWNELRLIASDDLKRVGDARFMQLYREQYGTQRQRIDKMKAWFRDQKKAHPNTPWKELKDSAPPQLKRLSDSRFRMLFRMS